jgi:hypothetical protein
MLITANTTITRTEIICGGTAPSGISRPKYPENATASAATVPLAMTAKLAQP